MTRRALTLTSIAGLAATAAALVTESFARLREHPAKPSDPSSAYPRDGFFRSYPIFEATMVEMPWPAIAEAARSDSPVLVPVGVIEAHGPHLGLGADIYISTCFARAARKELAGRGINALIAPPHYWGINSATGSFAGSFTVRDSTLIAGFEDLVNSMHGWGFHRFYVINFHNDPHYRSTLSAAMHAAEQSGDVAVTELDPVRGEVVPWPSSVPWDTHAGASETSLLAALYPGQVDQPLARTLPPRSGFTPDGYYGDPARFDPSGIQQTIPVIGRNLADQVTAAEHRR